MEKKRSAGVMIISIIMLMYSLWFVGDMLIETPGILFSPSDLYNSQGGWFMSPFVGLIYFISSLGIVKLKEWARKLAVYFSALISFLIVILIILVFNAAFQGECLPGVELLLIPMFSPSVIFLIYLTRPKVKEQFK